MRGTYENRPKHREELYSSGHDWCRRSLPVLLERIRFIELIGGFFLFLKKKIFASCSATVLLVSVTSVAIPPSSFCWGFLGFGVVSTLFVVIAFEDASVKSVLPVRYVSVAWQ